MTSAIFTKPSPSQSCCIENALTESMIPRNRESLKNISILRKITPCRRCPLTLVLFILDKRQKALRSSFCVARSSRSSRSFTVPSSVARSAVVYGETGFTIDSRCVSARLETELYLVLSVLFISCFRSA